MGKGTDSSLSSFILVQNRKLLEMLGSLSEIQGSPCPPKYLPLPWDGEGKSKKRWVRESRQVPVPLLRRRDEPAPPSAVSPSLSEGAGLQKFPLILNISSF